jgi:hypothetical protein
MLRRLRRRAETASFRLEELESRAVPTVSAIYSNDTLTVYGTEGDDTIVVHQDPNGFLYIDRSIAWFTTPQPIHRVEVMAGSGNDVVDFSEIVAPRKQRLTLIARGEDGSDTLWGSAAADTLVGGDGNDVLIGGSGSDLLQGDSGNDEIFGDAGSDRLHGGAGDDRQFGGNGADFLGGGGGTDILQGDQGRDRFHDVFDPRTWVVDGYAPADVQQGTGGTCSILATIAASGNAGEGVRGNISYLGNNTYRVELHDRWLFGLMHTSMHEDVEFDGTWYDHDAQPTQARSEDGSPTGPLAGDFWTTLYQRAVLQAEGHDWRDARSLEEFGMAERTAHHRILGDAETSRVSDDPELPLEMREALRNGAIVTAGTRDFGRDVDGAEIIERDGIISLHAYAVMDVYDNGEEWRIRMYNPWGWDATGPATDGRDDGFIDISWSVFADRFEVWTQSRL